MALKGPRDDSRKRKEIELTECLFPLSMVATGSFKDDKIPSLQFT